MLRNLALIALMSSCSDPTLPTLGTTPDGNVVGDGRDGDDTGGGDVAMAPDGTLSPTGPNVVLIEPASDGTRSLVVHEFLDDRHLLLGRQVTGSQSLTTGELALLDVTTRKVHPLGRGRVPFTNYYPEDLRPVFGSDDRALWMFGDASNAYLRDISKPDVPPLDLGPTTFGHYGLNAAGDVVVTVHEGVMQVRRVDGLETDSGTATEIASITGIQALVVGPQQQKLYWVANGYLFANAFDESLAAPVPPVGPANAASPEFIADGRYLKFEEPNKEALVLYDTVEERVVLNTTTAVGFKGPASRLVVANQTAYWAWYTEFWMKRLPDGVPEEMEGVRSVDAITPGIVIELNYEYRFVAFGGEALSPVLAYGRPHMGLYSETLGAAAMSVGHGSPWTVRWVDLATGKQLATPAPMTYRSRPLVAGDEWALFADEELRWRLQSFVSGATLTLEDAYETPEKAPVATDDGRLVARSGDGDLMVIDGDLKAITVEGGAPTYARTSGGALVYVRDTGQTSELVLIDLP